MAQIFHRSANTLARASILGIVLLLSAVGAALMQLQRSPYVTGQHIAPDQPVPFSHQHHVAGLGLDCRYCHSNVADGPRAGLPPSHTCMTCHSQIWTDAPMLAPVRQSLAENKSLVWHRVARLPEYVYFRHDIHVAKGVGCASCHGRIDRMPLTVQALPFTMEFCLECHRDPGPRLRPLDHVTDMGWAPGADARRVGEELVERS